MAMMIFDDDNDDDDICPFTHSFLPAKLDLNWKIRQTYLLYCSLILRLAGLIMAHGQVTPAPWSRKKEEVDEFTVSDNASTKCITVGADT